METCNAISTDEDGLWAKTEITTGSWSTFINYNGSGDDHVVIGGLPTELGPPIDLDLNNLPLAPLTIFENEAVWNFPVFREGVNIPKDGMYSWTNGDWGITEIGTKEGSCLNYLGYDAADNAIYPYVRHCRDTTTSPENTGGVMVNSPLCCGLIA